MDTTMFDQFHSDRAYVAAAAPAAVHALETGVEAFHILKGERHSSAALSSRHVTA